MILPDGTPIVVYRVMKLENNFLATNSDSKLYSRKGDAIRRCNKLNIQEHTTEYKVFGAYGWVEV